MKARQIMTDKLVTAGPRTSVAAAVALMCEHKVSGLPVVEGRFLVGILTEGDLMHRIETGTEARDRSWLMRMLVSVGTVAKEYVTSKSRVVGDLMTRDVITVPPSATLDEIVHTMERHKIRRVPVVHDKVLLGIVSRADIVRVLGQALGRLPLLPDCDGEIKMTIAREIAKHAWMDASLVEIGVADGVVTLKGTIFDERVRDALRVAAQTAPGVHAVKDELTWLDPVGSVPTVA